MAKPIKETPVLKGQDAVKFVQQMQKSDENKVDSETMRKMRESYERIKAISEPKWR